MNQSDWEQLVRLLQSLGLTVVRVDQERGEVTVRVEPPR